MKEGDFREFCGAVRLALKPYEILCSFQVSRIALMLSCGIIMKFNKYE